MSKVLFRLYSDGGYAVLDADGAPIDDEDGGGGSAGPRIVSHGEGVRVPLMLMDHAARDPREVAWLKMCDRLRDAWKQRGDPLPVVADAMAVKLPAASSKPRPPWAAPLLPPPAPVSEDPNSEMTASRLAYLRYKKRISTMYAGNRV